jgi:uncharacterized cupin superfamily protein
VTIWSDDWDSLPEDDWSGGGASSMRLPRGQHLGATVYELPSEGFAVYHVHHFSEELLIVLRGRPTLRTPGGERELEEGEVVHFPSGPDGAHGLANRTSGPVRYLMASTLGAVEVAEYPDLGKVTAQSRHDSQTGERLFVIHDVVEPDADPPEREG